jgi:Tol biopolymer transport system component
VAPNGSGVRQLTNVDSAHAAIRPNWSPNGSRIIFTIVRSNTPDDQARIWVMGADGTNAHQLSHDRVGFRDYTGTFTPDGRRIVFARCQPNDGVCAIWQMRADGSHMRATTPFRVGRNEAVDFDPSVSARGAIVFTRFFWRVIASQTWVIGLSSGSGRPVTPARLEAGPADWGPSGRTIDFGSNSQRFNGSLYQVGSDGAHLRRLTTARYPHSDFRPTHSPDGVRIAFVSDRRYPDLCCFDLFAGNADGTHLHRIATGLLSGISDPAWGPNAGGAGSVQDVPRVIPGLGRSSVRLPAVCRFEGTPAPYC